VGLGALLDQAVRRGRGPDVERVRDQVGDLQPPRGQQVEDGLKVPASVQRTWPAG
jgi:hypothetical protein